MLASSASAKVRVESFEEAAAPGAPSPLVCRRKQRMLGEIASVVSPLALFTSRQVGTEPSEQLAAERTGTFTWVGEHHHGGHARA